MCVHKHPLVDEVIARILSKQALNVPAARAHGIASKRANRRLIVPMRFFEEVPPGRGRGYQAIRLLAPIVADGRGLFADINPFNGCVL